MRHIMTGKRIILACALACGMSAFATNYYVSLDGSDSDNDGLSAETAFATVDKAVSTAVAGDAIYVAAGTYTTTTRNAPEVKCAPSTSAATKASAVRCSTSSSDDHTQAREAYSCSVPFSPFRSRHFP